MSTSLCAAIHSTPRTRMSGSDPLQIRVICSHIVHFLIKLCRFEALVHAERIMFPRKLLQCQRIRCCQKHPRSGIICQPAIDLEHVSILRIQKVQSDRLSQFAFQATNSGMPWTHSKMAFQPTVRHPLLDSVGRSLADNNSDSMIVRGYRSLPALVSCLRPKGNARFQSH